MLTGAEVIAATDPAFAGHRTAQRAVELLIEQDERYRCPTRAERSALLVGFAVSIRREPPCWE